LNLFLLFVILGVWHFYIIVCAPDIVLVLGLDAINTEHEMQREY
jgi:hypothetical protein